MVAAAFVLTFTKVLMRILLSTLLSYNMRKPAAEESNEDIAPGPIILASCEYWECG